MTATLVTHAFSDPGNNSSAQHILIPGAVSANDLICVFAPWEGSTTTVTSVADTKLNSYHAATGPTSFATAGMTCAIYYAWAIAVAAANSNTVTITWPTARNFGAIMVAVFHSSRGGFTSDPLVVAGGAQGAGTAASVTIAPATAGFIFSGVCSANAVTAAGSGFSIADGPTANDAYLSQYKLASASGSQAVTATTSGGFAIQAAAFKEPSTATTPDVIAFGVNF